MKKEILLFLSLYFTLCLTSCSQKPMNYNKLTREEERVILHKGTEKPFTGRFVDHKANGTYVCKRCNAPLYKSDSKFESHCGWPSFDDAIAGSVKRIPDADGMRTEIVCAKCGGHLGHVFEGEGFTPKNIRHCVNSVSMDFIANAPNVAATERAIFASGCFWGTEYYMQKAKGVITTSVGFIGGSKENPTYKEVCTGTTGHLEAVEIVYDPAVVSYEQLVQLFFETHDFTQTNGQGPDIGEQYLSAIFYINDNQKQIAEKLVQLLQTKGYKVATSIRPATRFWQAEDYHQDYYEIKGSVPYCHKYTKVF